MMALRLALVGVVLAALAAVALWSWNAGYDAAMAKIGRAVEQSRQETIRAAEQAGRIELERLALERERDALTRKLEDEANADPVLVPQCLGPSRLRRLNAR